MDRSLPKASRAVRTTCAKPFAFTAFAAKASTVLALALTGLQANAQDFPIRPVRILVGYQAGGGADAFSRLIAQKLQALWGHPVNVENRPGASGAIAADLVAKSPPDGHVVVMGGPNSHTTGPHVLKFPYDALQDFTPITLAVEVPVVVVVSQSLPVSSMKQLVDLAKASPGKLNYYSTGIGSLQELGGEMFNMVAGVKVVGIPYKGSAPAITDVIGGSVTMGFDPLSATLGQIQGGRLKALAIASDKRASSLPGVPTTAEAGFPQIVLSTWYGLFGPPGMPAAVVEKWQRDVARVIAMPDVAERIATLSAQPRANTPAEFSAFVRDEYTKMGKLIKQANIKAE